MSSKVMVRLKMNLSSSTQAYLDKLGFFGWQLGLQRSIALSRFFGRPERSFPSVHLAGTNGKGSTSAMLAALAQAAGLRVGLYTSPHLVHLNERIQINGKPISTRAFEALLRSCRPTVDKLKATYFEVLTAIAFKYFAEQQVDLAVIETGLGGQLDSTNIITPELSIITSIGLEHQDYLGKNLAEIAGEKAGIIKRHRPCISGVRQPQAAAVIATACRKQRARFIEAHKFIKISSPRYSREGTEFHARSDRLGFDYAKVRTNLLGSHQVKNAALAIAAARLLHNAGFNLNERAVREGLAQTHWPARMQLVHGDPELLLDAAHNADGMRVLTQTLARLFPGRRVKIVLSLMNDKAVAPVLRPWQKLHAEFFFTAAATARARPASDLLQQAHAMSLRGRAYDAAGQAFAAARASCRKNDLLCVAGSHYLIGELMQQGLLPYPY